MDFTKIKKLFIGGMELKQLFIGNKFDNKVPKSIDMDGSIYQAGKGYIDEYRLSSSGGLSGQANTVTTGFIEYQAGDLIRMSGVDWKPAITSETRYCYLAFYNSQFNVLGSINCFNTTDVSSGYNGIARGICTFKNGINMPSIANGVTTFDNINFSDTTQIAYFRVNGYGSGADMIVTVDEEIGMHQIWKSGYKNWVKYAIDTDGSLYNGLGYIDKTRLSSSGGISSDGMNTTTGFIPAKAGDIIRIKGYRWYTLATSTQYLIAYYSINNFAKVYTGTSQSRYQTADFIESMEYANGISTVKLKDGVGGYDYIRLCTGSYDDNDQIDGAATGANLIVTVNEEID